MLSALSSDQGVVRNQGITLGGSGTTRTLTLTPVLNASSPTTITLTVFDGLQSTNVGVSVTVTLDDPPTMTGPGDVAIVGGTPLAPITLTIGDDLIPATALTVTASSSNVLLVRNEDVVLGGTGVTRTMTLTAQPRAIGRRQSPRMCSTAFRRRRTRSC